MVYKGYGKQLGIQSYIFKIPEDHDVDQTSVSRTITALAKNQSFYSTRTMMQDYLSEYNRLCKTPNDESHPSCSAESQVDERVTLALLDLYDPCITLDFRRMNGNPQSTIFDKF